MGWYNRIMPTVEELEPLLKESAQIISNLPGVEEVRAWGTYAECSHQKKTPIREVDLLIKCSFNSGDMLAIEKGPMGPFSLPYSELEEEGFNIKAINFTKKLLKSCQFNAEFWSLSSDNKLLHWGPVSDTIDEWKEIRKNAEEKAETETGLTIKTIKQATQEQAKEWIQLYENALRVFINKGPIGWYQSYCPENQELLESSIKLT